MSKVDRTIDSCDALEVQGSLLSHFNGITYDMLILIYRLFHVA